MRTSVVLVKVLSDDCCSALWALLPKSIWHLSICLLVGLYVVGTERIILIVQVHLDLSFLSKEVGTVFQDKQLKTGR